MAHFLRDQRIENLSISEGTLIQLSAVFADRAILLNENATDTDASGKTNAFLTYVIRFDNKGYRLFARDDLLRHFNDAKSVERVIFTVETAESIQANRQIGSYLELRLDEKDPNSCFLSVTSDDRDWVDASFSTVLDTLSKWRNRNGWARTNWTVLGVQLVGVTMGFILSLWAATKISPKLSIDSPFVFSFLFILLMFSNTWTFVSQQLLRLVHFAFPNIRFLRRDKERLHWLLQTLIGAAVVAVALYVLGQASAFLFGILGDLINKST